ncbi:MAG: type IV pilus twitching motility protein PilT [Eubacteriales bacterium]
MPDEILRFLADFKSYLVLVTGPAASGKSTTLACIIDRINANRRGHIITIEDPIEFIHAHKQSVLSQREVEHDTKSYHSALRAALRQAPDVILLGEMRDFETIQTALTAAETGQLVLSTLHTIGAAKTIDRIIDVFPANQQQQIRVQLSMVLRAVVSQQLLPTLDGGLEPAFEIMLVNSAIQNMIRATQKRTRWITRPFPDRRMACARWMATSSGSIPKSASQKRDRVNRQTPALRKKLGD